MGCCLSSSNSSSQSPPHHSGSAYSHPIPPTTIGNRAPPPPLEEESVKEVLSETPKPKPHSPNCSGKLNGGIPIHPSDQISELSDLCSFTETLSTTTVTEKFDDYDYLHQRISRSPAKTPNNRSLSDDWAPRRDRPVGKSPSRKFNQSPGRVNGGTVKLVQGRDMGQGLASRSLRTESRLQNRTENSCRRSRSPATTRTDGGVSRNTAGRSPSVRRSGMSPGREATTGREAGQAQGAYNDEMIEGKWQTTNESIDNPLVSLECFIFL